MNRQRLGAIFSVRGHYPLWHYSYCCCYTHSFSDCLVHQMGTLFGSCVRDGGPHWIGRGNLIVYCWHGASVDWSDSGYEHGEDDTRDPGTEP